jgi:hypothetical protein
MTETIPEIDMGLRATIASLAFAGRGVVERSVSRFVDADLEANSRAPPFTGTLATRSGIQR